MKNSLRIISMILALTLMSGMLANDLGAAEDNARIEMILVQAGNGDGGVDSSLKPYAGTLQRLFRFKSYRQIKKQGMNLSIPGSTSASLGSGQTLKISADESGKNVLRADIEWKRGGKNLLHTRIQLRPGNPAVLGGPKSEDGTWLVILVLR